MSIQDSMLAAEKGKTIWDKGEPRSVPGLHCRVLPSGRRWLGFYYRTKLGQQRRVTLGALGPVTLHQARESARELAARVRLGEDPGGRWRDQRGKALTVAQLFELVHEQHWNTERFRQSGWAAQARGFFENQIKGPLGSTPIQELTSKRVRSWHLNEARTTPTAANRALRVLSKMMAWAIEQEILEGKNPCSGVAGAAEKSRGRFASAEELQRLGAAFDRMETEGDPQSQEPIAFLRLLMYTGSRPSALVRLRWENIQGDVASFPGKSSASTGEAEQVVLSPQAQAVLDKMGRKERGRVFSLQGVPRRTWERVRTEAGCPDLWARDWRRTWATVALSSGVPVGVVGEMLNHRSAQTTKRYAKLLGGVRSEAASSVSARVAELMSQGETK